ncbi:MAG: DUF4835 family protein [Parvicellaceae bacterium]
MIKYFPLIALFFVFCNGSAQELNCQVSVIAPTLQNNPANQEIIESLQSSVFEFVNNTKWTGDQYKLHERIECNILINIQDKISSDEFRGSIQISSSRPVFNSSYKTRLFNYSDPNLQFRYLRNTAIIFKPDNHFDNLADVLAFYVYMLIGYDYDSYSLEGGTPFFDKAMQIVSNCQNAPEPGWKPSEGNRNRYWLIQNATQALFKPLRQCYYDFHRKGFDVAYSNRQEGLSSMFDALKLLDNIHKARPNSFNIQLFFTAKNDEIVGLFSPDKSDLRMRVYNLLVKLDPGNISKYNKIKAGTK